MNDGGLAARRRAWLALSELYLDTEIDAGDYRLIAGELAASGFDPPTLEAILLREVHPVAVYNLMSPAGAWTGFDPDTLYARIEARLRRPRWLRLLDPEAVFPLPLLFRRQYARYPREQWRILEPLIAAARAGVAGP